MATDEMTSPVRPITAPDGGARQPDRLTAAGGWTLLAICVLHALVVAAGSVEWFGPWLEGPFRTEQLPVEALSMFWALPGSFVVFGSLLGISLIRDGRRGHTAALYVPVAIGVWAALCVWILGPSGFLAASVPVALLTVAALRGRKANRA